MSGPSPASGVLKTVMVVDDHPFNGEIAAEMLRHLGFDAEVAQSGLEAVERFDPALHHAVLMDLQMPGLNGVEATKRIRHQWGGGVPIIALTANVGASDRQDCLDAGMVDFIGKPFGLAQLEETLARWVGRTPDACETRGV